MKPNIKPYIKQFYRGNFGYLALYLVQTLLVTSGALLISWLIQQIIDVVGGQDTGFGLLQLVGFGVLGIALLCGGCLFAYISKPKFISKASSQYKNYVFSELSQKGISAFSNENTSTYISALSNDINSIENGYLVSIFTVLDQVFMFVGAFSLMLYYNPMLTFVSIAFASLPLLAALLTGGLVQKHEKVVSAKNDSYMAMLRDCLSGFSVIKSFRAEKQMQRLFAEKVADSENSKEKRRKAAIIVRAAADAAGSLLQVGIMLFGAYLALSGNGISAGSVLVFVQLLNYIINPIAAIPTAISEISASKGLIAKLATALEKSVRTNGEYVPAKLDDRIELKNVNFGYEEGQTVLKNVSAVFEKGKSYALVGASGSGKTTLLNLLMAGNGNYSGEILFDGQELKAISSESLYNTVSIIQQNVFVFNDTIKNNITMFSEFEQGEVEQAIGLSGLSKLVTRNGEDYLCGENGCNLSGGEKQRISIARSLLRKSPVLLVDEATAALDKETAYNVFDSILNLQGLTRVVITHALEASLLKRYDNILVMKNGEIAESGSFDELMNKKGYFYALYTTEQ